VIRITLLAETAFLASKCLMVAIFHLDPGWRSTALIRGGLDASRPGP
jgi:hypothetical protein